MDARCLEPPERSERSTCSCRSPHLRRSVLALVLAICSAVYSVQLAGTYTVAGVKAIDGDFNQIETLYGVGYRYKDA